MDSQTRDKVREYVKETTTKGGNWSDVADSICYALEKGSIVSIRSILYDADGKVVGIKGMEVLDGVLQFKQKKKPLKAVVENDETSNPLIEQLRNATLTKRRKVVTL